MTILSIKMECGDRFARDDGQGEVRAEAQSSQSYWL